MLLTLLIICGSMLELHAQVPVPRSSTDTSSDLSTPLSWKKNGLYDYTLTDASGKVLTNTLALNYLKMDTLSYLDKSSRTIYILPDSKGASNGATGKLVVLKKNVSKDFYVTNPKSFVTYINDQMYSGDFVNVDGSYVYYLDEFDTTYYHEGIRSFPSWGVNNITKMPASDGHVYWYRNAEKGTYGLIEKGKTVNYDLVTTEKSGNELVVSMNGVKKWIMPGYYTMASYVIKPAQKYSGSSGNTAGTGCVSGDCNNGWGKWQYENGYYDGFWTNGKKQGYGLYKWTGVGKYIGNWENDTMNGYGAYIADNEDNIVGEYRNGQLNGRGYQVINSEWDQGWYTDGSITEQYGYYRNDVDMGCTSGDCQNKYGYFKWDNGDHFVGFFKDGQLYLGTYTFKDGSKYSGMFNSKGEYHGTGRFFYTDGSYFGREWRNGKQEGKGYFHDKDLVQQIGIWSNGSLVTNMKN